jgi:hypothetical protein
VNVFMDGPAAIETEEHYTYIFGGLAQFIDTILVTPPLAELVVETMIVHSNADFPYTLGGDTSTAGLPYFFSDHDVPILLMSLEKEEPPPTEEPTAAAPVVTASPSPVVVTPVSDSGVPDVDPEEKFEVNLVMLMLGAAVVSVILNILWRRVRGK